MAAQCSASPECSTHKKLLTPADRTILVWGMSLSTQTKFLLDAAFTMAAAEADMTQIQLWLNLAEESHGGELSPSEWAEVQSMLTERFPDLVARHRFLLPYIAQKAQESHPTCGCDS